MSWRRVANHLDEVEAVNSVHTRPRSSHRRSAARAVRRRATGLEDLRRAAPRDDRSERCDAGERGSGPAHHPEAGRERERLKVVPTTCEVRLAGHRFPGLSRPPPDGIAVGIDVREARQFGHALGTAHGLDIRAGLTLLDLRAVDPITDSETKAAQARRMAPAVRAVFRGALAGALSANGS